MEFYTARELRTNTKSIWDDLLKESEVIITNNGKPSAMMIGIPEGKFDETVRVLRQVKAIAAMERMREKAAKYGYLSDDEIESAIKDARKE